MTAFAYRVIERIEEGSGCTLVRGCRWSGKSHLAAELERALPGAWRSRAQDWLGDRPALDDRGLIERNVSRILGAVRAERPRVWILEPAEHLLAFAGADFVEACAALPHSHGVRIVWIRNRLVDEDGGELARAESPLRERGPVLDLPLLDPEERRALAGSHAWDAQDPEAVAAWLVDWSGGLGGMIPRLKPWMACIGDLVGVTLAHFDLANPVRAALLHAALGGWLPPLVALDPRTRLHLGYLVAIGALRPAHGREVSDGRFWRTCVEAAAARIPRPADATEAALRLEGRLAAAGLLDEVVDWIGVGADVADAFDRILRFARAAPAFARDPAALVAEVLGRVGLGRALQANRIPAPREARAEELGALLLSTEGA